MSGRRYLQYYIIVKELISRICKKFLQINVRRPKRKMAKIFKQKSISQRWMSKWPISIWKVVREMHIKTTARGTSLVAQWLRIHLPMQGMCVWALVQEDPTCHGATKPMCHNYWACTLEPMSCNYWARMPQLLKPACPRACTLQLLSLHTATTEACAP